MASSCVTCGGLGFVSLNPNISENSPKAKRKASYCLGNNEFTASREKVASTLLRRHFPKIYKLSNIDCEEFVPGKLGIIKVPDITLSTIPKVAEPDVFGEQLSVKESSNLTSDQINEINVAIKKEKPEMTVFEGINDYFQKVEEDCFIVYNQDLSHRHQNRQSEKE